MSRTLQNNDIICYGYAHVLLYAKDRRASGDQPLAWNIWQKDAYQIADCYACETLSHRGKSNWFSLLRDKTMEEVYGAGFRKLVTTSSRRRVSRARPAGSQELEDRGSAAVLVTPVRQGARVSTSSLPEGLQGRLPPPLPPVDAACFELASAPGLGQLRERAGG